MGGEAKGFQEDVLLVGKGLNYCIEKLVSHVVLIHLFCPEEVLVIYNQQTSYLLQHFMRQIIPSIFLQIPLKT